LTYSLEIYFNNIFYIDLLSFRTYSYFTRSFVCPSLSYKDDYIQSEFFSLIPIHSIKFKLELTSINVLLLIHTLLLFSSSPFSITRQIKHFILSHSLILYVANTTTSVCVNREQTSLYYIPIHTNVFSYSYWPIHLLHTYTFSTTTTTLLRDIISTSLFLLLSIFIIIYIYIYISKVRE